MQALDLVTAVATLADFELDHDFNVTHAAKGSTARQQIVAEIARLLNVTEEERIEVSLLPSQCAVHRELGSSLVKHHVLEHIT